MAGIAVVVYLSEKKNRDCATSFLEIYVPVSYTHLDVYKRQAVTIVILAMTVTFSITMLIAMRLFDSTVSSVKDCLLYTSRCV